MSTPAALRERPNLVLTVVLVLVLLVGGSAGAYLLYSGAQDPPAPQGTPGPAGDLRVEASEAQDMLEEDGDIEPLDLDSLVTQQEQQERPGGPPDPFPEREEPVAPVQGSEDTAPAQEPSVPAQSSTSSTGQDESEPPVRSRLPSGSIRGGIVDVGPPVLPEDFDPEDLGPYVRTNPVPASMEPLRLQVPSIYVDAGIVSEGISASARDQYGQSVMELPDSLGEVGWLDTTAALDSDKGTTLLAGHVTVEGVHGAVYFLGLTEPGALVKTTDAGGEVSRWVVTEVVSYGKTALPKDIFEPTGPRALVVVTCGGDVVQLADGSWSHEENIVVRAVPAR